MFLSHLKNLKFYCKFVAIEFSSFCAHAFRDMKYKNTVM
jgi:hypothetical protein